MTEKRKRGRPREYPTLPGESAIERKRRLDRQYIAARRANMSAEERAEKRREHDEKYRARRLGA